MVQLMQEAGGFITNTADNVVQPYILPRDLHEPARSPGPSQMAAAAAAHDADPADSHAERTNGARVSLKLETYDLDESADTDAPEASTRGSRVPKTMRELAEATGTGAEADTVADDVIDIDMGEDDDDDNVVEVEPIVEANSRRGRRGTTKGAKPHNGKTPARRGRKRALSDVGEAIGEANRPNTPTKRSRKRAAPSSAIVKSDRVLRTRRPKDAQDELDDDEAFERAIAD